VILKAAWVVPVSALPIRDGYVEIEGDRIVDVGAAGVREFPAGAAEDLGEVVLVPGLVNPHTHLELGCYAGLLEPAPFWTWLQRLARMRREPDNAERERESVSEGAWRSLRAGVTCVGDISRENVAWQALKNLPIRKVCFVELIHRAEKPPRDVAELSVAVASVDEDDLLTAGITPHAPYSVPADQIRGAVALAEELGRPWTVHWAETLEEVAFLGGKGSDLPGFLRAVVNQCQVESPRSSPTEYLSRCTKGRLPGLLAHVNYIEDEELEPLSAAGHRVVYCPRAHRFFGHSPHPLPRLLRAGVSVVLGTDSLASNDSLSVLDEARYVRAHLPDVATPELLLRMITLDAAAALGLADRIGSLEAGKQADLAAFACPAEARDPVEALLTQSTAADAVWVAGRRVV